MSKQIKNRPSNLIAASGDGWRIELDREINEFVAIIDGVGAIGYFLFHQDARTAIDNYRYEQLRRAA